MRQLFIPLSKAFGLYMIYTGLCYAFTVFPMIIYQLSSPEDPVMGMTMVKVFGIGVPATGISFAAVLALTLIGAWVLLIKPEWLADRVNIPQSNSLPEFNALSLISVGIKLIGIFAIVQGVPILAQAIFYAVERPFIDSYVWSMTAPSLLRITIGLLLIMKTSLIIRYTDAEIK